MLTISKCEFFKVKCTIRELYLELTKTHEKLNKVGSNKSMTDLDELLVYLEIMETIYDDWDFINTPILGDSEIYRLHNRALELNVNTKRNVL